MEGKDDTMNILQKIIKAVAIVEFKYNGDGKKPQELDILDADDGFTKLFKIKVSSKQTNPLTYNNLNESIKEIEQPKSFKRYFQGLGKNLEIYTIPLEDHRVLAITSDKTFIEALREVFLVAKQIAAKNKIALMAGHDLRALLQVIQNAVYLSQKQPENLDASLNMIESAIKRAIVILDDLKFEADTTPLNISMVDLGELIHDVVEEAWVPNNISVNTIIGEGLDAVPLDRGKMRRVLDNLLRNALEASSGDSSITFQASLEGEKLRVNVVDEGEGIPEDFKGRLFIPFQGTKADGLGLGLVYCKEVVEAHGGRINLESIEGEGTSIMIKIPIKK
jgi:signal transduction histidine kinase